VTFHVDFLAWSQLDQDDVGIRRCRRTLRKHDALLALGFPDEAGRQGKMVDVELGRVSHCGGSGSRVVWFGVAVAVVGLRVRCFEFSALEL
jgi:hypothetical protein